MVGPAQVLLSGIALGLSIAAPPGPVTALAAQEVSARSWFSGWQVTLGATAADAVFFVLTYFGVARLVTGEERDILFFLGGILMLYLAFVTARNARSPHNEEKGVSPISRAPFVIGLSMGLTNPYQLGWWVAIGAGMVSEFGARIAVGFFIGIVGWTLAMTATVHASVTRYRSLAPMIAYASAALMATFGAWFLATGLAAFR